MTSRVSCENWASMLMGGAGGGHALQLGAQLLRAGREDALDHEGEVRPVQGGDHGFPPDLRCTTGSGAGKGEGRNLAA